VTTHWPTTRWTDAGQIFEFVGGAIAHAGSPDDLQVAPDAYFKTLIEGGRLRDAVFYVSHALPRYEGVVWAVQALLAADAVDRNNQLVVAVLRWIDDPCEELRRAIERLLNDEVVTSPAYMLAMAAFMSGGSISLPEYPPVLAPPDASAKFAAGAVFDAAYASGNPASLLRQAADIGDALASRAPQR
jgi:hypothetical protein